MWSIRLLSFSHSNGHQYPIRFSIPHLCLPHFEFAILKFKWAFNSLIGFLSLAISFSFATHFIHIDAGRSLFSFCCCFFSSSFFHLFPFFPVLLLLFVLTLDLSQMRTAAAFGKSYLSPNVILNIRLCVCVSCFAHCLIHSMWMEETAIG